MASGGSQRSAVQIYVCIMCDDDAGTKHLIQSLFLAMAQSTANGKSLISSKTHYEVLKVSRTATFEEIKTAHRNLARLSHPDKVAGNECTFRQLQKAWECLRDEQSRKAYDEELAVKEAKLKSRRQAAMPLSLSGMEVGQDDESGELVYVYACRCGEEVHVWQQDVPPAKQTILTDCSGCSFTYSIVNDLT